MDNEQRKGDHKRNVELEAILKTLNSQFSQIENDLAPNYAKLQFPPVFIVGIARSGSTLVYQYLASTGLFSYPSNIISRFYQAPYIGALLHKMFIDLDDKNEFFSKNIGYSSQLGKTEGAASPHEFWYFWRRFFNFDKIQKLGNDELKHVDLNGFIKGLSSIEAVFDKPLLMKGMILNWNLDYLYQNLPDSIFIFVHRDPVMHMHSLYKARKSFFGTVDKWYSFLPPEYPELKKQSVYEQLAGQVILGNQSIKKQMDGFDQKRYIDITYEDFCKNPPGLVKQITERMAHLSRSNMKQPNLKYQEAFEISDAITDAEFDENKARDAINAVRHGNT
ncbi:MAG: sulfotransferase [bacterium]